MSCFVNWRNADDFVLIHYCSCQKKVGELYCCLSSHSSIPSAHFLPLFCAINHWGFFIFFISHSLTYFFLCEGYVLVCSETLGLLSAKAFLTAFVCWLFSSYQSDTWWQRQTIKTELGKQQSLWMQIEGENHFRGQVQWFCLFVWLSVFSLACFVVSDVDIRICRKPNFPLEKSSIPLNYPSRIVVSCWTH